MTWLISLLFTLSGITITEDGYIIDKQQKELEKLERIFWDADYVDKLKYNKNYIYIEPVTNKKERK
ncbi:TPA: hypothetical protein CPT94_06690 [Candidatus Gastranaerophilales bacterium HUM_22]|nr:MAG TPA: hypothetical protein CPT94_06690 [Candidatus Gastranaerophilales bacterium HUM_22]